jgi:phosphoglycolate phosphatase-like HAD superfamily hydrolase
MRPVAVEWGYHHPDNAAPGAWQADAVISRPADLISLLERTP